MIKQFENLSDEEKKLLFIAPVLLSVLASCSDHGVNQDQKADAIKLSHLKTFTADPMLIPFYIEVEKNFKEQFESTTQEYLPLDEAKRRELQKKISRIDLVLGKLDKDYAKKIAPEL